MFCCLWYSEWSKVAQSCLTLCSPMDCSLSGSAIHGIFQARVLEWIAISFSRGSSRPVNWTQVSRIAGRRFTVWATREALAYLFPYWFAYLIIYLHWHAAVDSHYLLKILCFLKSTTILPSSEIFEYIYVCLFVDSSVLLICVSIITPLSYCLNVVS